MIGQYANVVGYGRGYKNFDFTIDAEKFHMMVLVSKKLPLSALSAKDIIPREIDGIPTDVVMVGELRAQYGGGFINRATEDVAGERVKTESLGDNLQYHRPAPGGVSIGHYKITAGTLGCVVRRKSDGKRVILSNNHVLANSNDAEIGDAIYQPGPYDGGGPAEQIAMLSSFMPIIFGTGESTCSLANAYARFGNWLALFWSSRHRIQAFTENLDAKNLMDAALAVPLSDALVADEILEIGKVGSNSAYPHPSMFVKKSGRTTGLTRGEVTVINATVQVSYGEKGTAIFEDQIVSTAMSQGGDSGSLLVGDADDRPQPVGLLFAGSDQATIYNPLAPIEEALGFEFISAFA